MNSAPGAFLLLRGSWLGLLAWQWVWHAALPRPLGSQNWLLALVAFIPLLAMTLGVLRAAPRRLFWSMFLVMLYFIVGVMECWSNPPQRLGAAGQIAFCIAYFAGLLWVSPRNRRAPG